MESHVINRIRRHLLLLDIFSYGKSRNRLQDIYCGWQYFPMESRVINRIRRHLLSLAISSHRKLCNKSDRRHLLPLVIFSHGKSCNKMY